MISRVKPRKWLARFVQGRRSFSFALLCCVHQRAGVALIKRERKKRSHLAWAATLPGRHKKHVFARRAFFPGGGLRRNAKGRRRLNAPGLAEALQRRRRWRRSAAALFAGAQRPEVEKIQ